MTEQRRTQIGAIVSSDSGSPDAPTISEWETIKRRIEAPPGDPFYTRTVSEWADFNRQLEASFIIPGDWEGAEEEREQLRRVIAQMDQPLGELERTLTAVYVRGAKDMRLATLSQHADELENGWKAFQRLQEEKEKQEQEFTRYKEEEPSWMRTKREKKRAAQRQAQGADE